MNKLLQIVALFVLAFSAANAATYITIAGYNNVQYFMSGFCQKPSTGQNYAYIYLNSYQVQYNTYSDNYCQMVYSSTVMNFGIQPSNMSISYTSTVDLRATNYYYNVIYGTGSFCNGDISYAYAQPVGQCLPMNNNSPNGGSTFLQCTQGGYTQYYYNYPNCVGPYTYQQFSTGQYCSVSPGSFSTCVAN